MAFDGSEGDPISLDAAASMTLNYRNANPGATKGHFFGKTIINDILRQTGCVGIRTYYGIDSAGKKQLILAGAKANEDDMHTGLLADFSTPCPNFCGSANPLNS